MSTRLFTSSPLFRKRAARSVATVAALLTISGSSLAVANALTQPTAATEQVAAETLASFPRTDLLSASLPELGDVPAVQLSNGEYEDPSGAFALRLDLAGQSAEDAPTITEVPLAGGTGMAALVSVDIVGPTQEWVVLWDAAGTPLGAVQLTGYEELWPESGTGLSLSEDGSRILARYAEETYEDSQLGNLYDLTAELWFDEGGVGIDETVPLVEETAFGAGANLFMAVLDGDAEAEARYATPEAIEQLDATVEGGPSLRQYITGTEGSFTEWSESIAPTSDAPGARAWRTTVRLDAPNDDVVYDAIVERTVEDGQAHWIVTGIDYTPEPGHSAPDGH